jgi:Fur family ferric uptake transcriptional regulator
MQLPLNYFFHSMTRFEFDQIHSNHHDSAGPAAFEPRPSAKVNGQSIQLPTSKAGELVLAQIEYDEAALKALIRRMHLKVTPQRMAILRHLVDGPRHTTVQELYDKVVVQHPDVGFATVYRLLKSMTESRLVTETRIGGLPARYELTPHGHHDHLTCSTCGQIYEFENRSIEDLQEKIAKEFGFKLTHHVLELYGVCASCQNRLAKGD